MQHFLRTCDGRYPALELVPEERRQRTLEALVAQVAALSRQSPLLMIFEDAHWTDPTSLELFGRIVDRIPTLRVLLIVTFRPEFDPPWIGRPYVTVFTLNRLARRDIEAMIDHVVGNKLVPASVRQDIIERTDGIPLFVEEMTKAVLEAYSEGAVQVDVASISTLGVPASLQASLMARLDRLGPAKQVAQIGAAIGREFSHTLLATVVRKPEAELHSALDRLIVAGLLFRQGIPPQATYLFKHALIQDAAYGTLLREPRRALHTRIAEALESQFPEIAENQPELLARHCSEAGLAENAIRYWLEAARQARNRYALAEAERFVEHAVTLGPENAAALIGLSLIRTALAGVFSTDRQAHLAAAEAAATKAVALAPGNAPAHFALGQVYMATNRAALGIAEFEQAIALDKDQARAYAGIGHAMIILGRAEETEDYIHQALRVSPRDSMAHLWYYAAGAAKLCLGCDEEAVVWLRQAVAASPWPIARFTLAAALALQGKTAEAKSAAAAGLAVNPYFTIRGYKIGALSDNPTYLAQRERIYEGLRRAGVPEG
jgi:predicted ATPase